MSDRAPNPAQPFDPQRISSPTKRLVIRVATVGLDNKTQPLGHDAAPTTGKAARGNERYTCPRTYGLPGP